MMLTPDTPPPVLRRGIMDTSSKLPPMQKQNQSLKSLAPSITEDYLVNVLSLADNMWHVETQRCRHSFSPETAQQLSQIVNHLSEVQNVCI